MPRNVYTLKYEKGFDNPKNVSDYREFVENYIRERQYSGQFVNCKIYGNTSDGEVYTTWIYDKLPNKKELKIAGVIEEIAPTKQGFPCCILSRELDGADKKVVQKGIKDFEICYEFKMVKFSEMDQLDDLTYQGWKVRKWFESLNIYTIEDIELGNRTPQW